MSLLPLTKKVSLKSFNQCCLQCKYIFDIIIYYTICKYENIDIFLEMFPSIFLYCLYLEAYITVLKGIAWFSAPPW